MNINIISSKENTKKMTGAHLDATMEHVFETHEVTAEDI